MRSVKSLGRNGCARIIIHGSPRKGKLTPTIELPLEVGFGILYACISDSGCQGHGVERHLQIHRHILQFQVMQCYAPVQGGFGGILRSFGSVGKHHLHMGIAQFHPVQYGILFIQVYAVTGKEEPSERTFYAHAFQQAGRVYGHPLQSDVIHLYPSFQ